MKRGIRTLATKGSWRAVQEVYELKHEMSPAQLRSCPCPALGRRYLAPARPSSPITALTVTSIIPGSPYLVISCLHCYTLTCSCDEFTCASCACDPP